MAKTPVRVTQLGWGGLHCGHHESPMKQNVCPSQGHRSPQSRPETNEPATGCVWGWERHGEAVYSGRFSVEARRQAGGPGHGDSGHGLALGCVSSHRVAMSPHAA